MATSVLKRAPGAMESFCNQSDPYLDQDGPPTDNIFTRVETVDVDDEFPLCLSQRRLFVEVYNTGNYSIDDQRLSLSRDELEVIAATIERIDTLVTFLSDGGEIELSEKYKQILESHMAAYMVGESILIRSEQRSIGQYATLNLAA